jgi:hypothetical protein
MLKSLLHQICLIALPIILAIGSIIFMPLAAQAKTSPSTYQNPSGSTQLLMDNSNPGRMEYRTKLPGEDWSGEIRPTSTVKQNGTVMIYGTFRDSPGDSLSDKVFCTGDVIAIQSFSIDRFLLDINWTVTGGKDCAEVGTQFGLKLSEVLPGAD